MEAEQISMEADHQMSFQLKQIIAFPGMETVINIILWTVKLYKKCFVINEHR